MPSNDEELAKDQPKPEISEKKSKSEDSEKAKSDASVKSDKVKSESKSKTETGKSKESKEPKATEETELPIKQAETLEGAIKAEAKENAKAEKLADSAPMGEEPKRNIKSMVIKVAAVVVTLIAVIVGIFGVLIYGYKSDNSAVRVVAAVVPYPAQRVNGNFVSYNAYLFEVDANKRAYQNNAKLNNQPAVDFNSADGKKMVKQIKEHSLEKLKSDALVAQLAAKKKVKVTDKEVDELIDQLYQRYGGKDTLLKTLNQIYGWELNDLKSVVRKQLLAKNLEDKVTADPKVDSAAKTKAQDVLKKVKDNGDFAALAKQHSQASDAATGGDLGFFTKGQLPDNLQTVAEALQPGQTSDVIKTQYGYEIIKVVEKKEDGSIHALHILTKTIDFNEYFQDELKKAKVNNYIKV